MAAPEAVEQFISGPAAWNAWRRQHPDRTDLTGACIGSSARNRTLLCRLAGCADSDRRLVFSRCVITPGLTCPTPTCAARFCPS